MISFEGSSEYSTGIYPFGAWLYSGTTLHVNNVLDANKTIRITQLIQESFEYDFIPTGVFVPTWNYTEVSSLIYHVRIIATESSLCREEPSNVY